MKREMIIKKAMDKLRSVQFEALKKELNDYIKEDAKEVFDYGDVKVSGRVDWSKDGEEVDLKDMEIDSAVIKGFAHYMLHDMYEGSIPDKKQREEDAEILHKEFVGHSFPFKARIDEDDLSGELKVLKTEYNIAKDEVHIIKDELEDIQIN